MDTRSVPSLRDALAEVPDFRQAAGRRYELLPVNLVGGEVPRWPERRLNYQGHSVFVDGTKNFMDETVFALCLHQRSTT